MCDREGGGRIRCECVYSCTGRVRVICMCVHFQACAGDVRVCLLCLGNLDGCLKLGVSIFEDCCRLHCLVHFGVRRNDRADRLADKAKSSHVACVSGDLN